MYGEFKNHLNSVLSEITEKGLLKDERVISSAQGARISVGDKANILNMCANNYLGLSNHPQVIAAAHKALDRWGYGLSSVRFICGTQEIHKVLEQKLSDFLGTEDTILYSSCFDANGGVFETLLGEEDAIISDELNHASIIDGIRLCKAKRLRYKNSNMEDLEIQLKEAKSNRFRMIVTDGVFSMDGYIANLPAVCELAEKYNALVLVDDSHAVGFMGKKGRGTHEFHNVMSKVDIITGTLGKALGGASGGYVSGKREVVKLLRQRSRPYLFSNSLAPVIAETSIEALNLLSTSTELRDRLEENTKYFRKNISTVGFEVLAGEHPIVPIMLGDAKIAKALSESLLKKGIYVIGFSYPVVPLGKARIRTQISAAHSRKDLDYAIEMFSQAKQELAL